jgi:SAM-dependent methyltransferase
MTARASRTRWAARASALYDEGYARRYRAHDEQLPASPPSQELARWLRDVCQRFAGPIDALDLGCGTGRYFWALTGVQSLEGVDASAAMLAQAERPYRQSEITVPKITLREGDLLSLALPAASFDLVYSIGVLAEHTPLTASLVARVRQWLRPGGRFAFTTVHPESPSIPLTFKRKAARHVAGFVPALIGNAVRTRLLAGGMYADEAFIYRLAEPAFTVESLDRFTSEAHLHMRAVLRKPL